MQKDVDGYAIKTLVANRPSHTATHCITLQHTATQTDLLTRQHTASHCNTLHHTAAQTDLLTRQRTASHCITLHRTAAQTDLLTLQHTASHCNTLQHTAAHCNTLKQTFALCVLYVLQQLSRQCVAVCDSVLQCVAKEMHVANRYSRTIY